MSDSGQLERGKREERGGASRQRPTHTPPGPAPRQEVQGGRQGAEPDAWRAQWLGVLPAA